MPEELLDKEKAEFVGVEEEFLKIENGSLMFTLTLSRHLGESAGVSMYVFGYKSGTPFSDMPKIHIRFGAIEHNIFDQAKKLPLEAIRVDRKEKNIHISIPRSHCGEARTEF